MTPEQHIERAIELVMAELASGDECSIGTKRLRAIQLIQQYMAASQKLG